MASCSLRWAGKFDVLITTDKHLRHQQSLAGRPLAVIVLHAAGIRLPDLLPLVSRLLEVLNEVQPGARSWYRVSGFEPSSRCGASYRRFLVTA